MDRIDHVAVAVHDIEASSPYYTDRLGLPVVHDEVAEEPGVRLVYLDAGNAFLQLVQPVRPGPVATFLAERGEGLHHVCYAVAELEPVLAALPGEQDTAVFRGGRDRRACFLATSPPGALVELTEHLPRPPG